MKFSENLSNIAAALCKVQAEIKNPIKNQVNKGVTGAPLYANLEETLQDYVRPILTKHDMSVYQSVKTDQEDKVGVCTVLLHSSGEYIESDYVYCKVKIPTNREGREVLTQGQATGVNITYLRRYSLNAALGINGDKDTDGSYTDREETAAQLTYETALNYVLDFGKYKDKTLKEIWEIDTQYISWLANNDKADARIKEAIQIINTEINKKRSNKEDHE